MRIFDALNCSGGIGRKRLRTRLLSLEQPVHATRDVLGDRPCRLATIDLQRLEGAMGLADRARADGLEVFFGERLRREGGVGCIGRQGEVHLPGAPPEALRGLEVTADQVAQMRWWLRARSDSVKVRGASSPAAAGVDRTAS